MKVKPFNSKEEELLAKFAISTQEVIEALSDIVQTHTERIVELEAQIDKIERIICYKDIQEQNL